MDRTGRTLWSSPSPGVALSGPFPDPGRRNSESSGGGLTRWTAALCRRTAGLRGRGVPGDLSHPPGQGAHELALLGKGRALGDLHVLADASELGELLLRQPVEKWGALECLDLGVLTEEPHRGLTYPGEVAESSCVEV